MLNFGRNVGNLTCWGDSLTAGAGASSSALAYPPVTGGLYTRGRWVWQGGVGGQTSVQIGTRQGGIAAIATVSGGQIPASGGVIVTFPSGYEPVTSQGPGAGVSGTLSGVPGVITYSAGTITFTRTTAGSVVNVASAQFYPDVNFSSMGSQVIWAGRNDYSNGAQVQASIASMAAFVANGKYLVISVTTGSDTPNPSTAYTQITAINTALASTYGTRYVDVLSTLVALGAPGQPYADPTSYAGGYPPSGLRSDSAHLNDAGYSIVAQQIYAALVAKGW